MEDKAVDRRIRKTERAMRDALFSLMEEKPFSQINVRELVERSDVNRSTFYRHYLDIPDMAEQLEASFVDGAHAILLRYADAPEPEIPVACMSEMLEYVKENRSIFLALASENGDPRFLRSMETMYRDFAHEHLWPRFDGSRDGDDPRPRLIFAFFFPGFLALAREWLEGGCQQDVAYLAQLASSLDRHAQLAFRET